MEAHAEDLRQVTGDDNLAQQVKRDYEAAGIDAPTRALLRFACKLTRDATEVRREDIETLRAQGLTDRAILDGTVVAALFNYFNRVADALGIDLEPHMPPPDAPATGGK